MEQWKLAQDNNARQTPVRAPHNIDQGEQAAGIAATPQRSPFVHTSAAAQVDPFADLLSFPSASRLLPGTTSTLHGPARVARVEFQGGRRHIGAYVTEIVGCVHSGACSSVLTSAARTTSGGQEPSTPDTRGAVASGSASLRVIPIARKQESLEAKKRESQESRQKRDEFLKQMSSFLKGIEDNNADVAPPDAATSMVDVASRPIPQPSSASRLYPTLPDLSLVPHDVPGSSSSIRSVDKQDPPTTSLMQEGPPGCGSSPNERALLAGFEKMSRCFECNVAPAEVEKVLNAGDVSTPGVNATTREAGGLTEVFGGSIDPHPRGSLFDDDILDLGDVSASLDAQEASTEGRPMDFAASQPAGQRSSSVPIQTSFQDARRPRQQARLKAKTTETRGLDLEEVRRRTSLLSGEAHDSAPLTRSVTVTTTRMTQPSDLKSAAAMGSRREQSESFSLPRTVPGSVTHPLHPHPESSDPLFAAAVGGEGTFDDRGNYFNEDALLARAKSSGSNTGFDPLYNGSGGTHVGSGHSARRGEALMDTAGSFLTTARDGAKILFRDAKAGVGAVGASVSRQMSQGKSRHGFEDGRGEHHSSQGNIDGDEKYEVTFGEGKFGFTLLRAESGPQKGKGVVSRLSQNGTAQSLGVKIGDVVTGVNKRRYDTYDEVMEVLPNLPRPILITFQRKEPTVSSGTVASAAAGDRSSSIPPSQTDPPTQGGSNPLEWLGKLNPFDKDRRNAGDGTQGVRTASSPSMSGGKKASPEAEVRGGEAFANGLGGGVFSWSYYGTSEGMEPNTRDTYTEHVMRCQWGRTVNAMQSWMVARRYREFDALDMDLRDAYPDKRDDMPRLPPKEFFKMAPDVVERRAKGLELYMTTIVRQFPDMLESPHLDRFLTISERISAIDSSLGTGTQQQVSSYRDLKGPSPSFNVFAASGPANAGNRKSSLVGTDFILNLMTSEDAYRLAQERRPHPVALTVAESLITELEDHLANISPTAHLLSDAKLYNLVERCEECWPRIKAAAAAAVSGEAFGEGRGESSGDGDAFLPRILQCDEGMERAINRLRTELTSRGYINSRIS